MSFDLDKAIKGRVWKFGDSVDTNQLASTQSGDGDIRDWLRRNCLRNLRAEFPGEVQPGDIIVAVNGRPMNSVEDLRILLKDAGKRIAVLVQREDARIFVPVNLG